MMTIELKLLIAVSLTLAACSAPFTTGALGLATGDAGAGGEAGSLEVPLEAGSGGGIATPSGGSAGSTVGGSAGSASTAGLGGSETTAGSGGVAGAIVPAGSAGAPQGGSGGVPTMTAGSGGMPQGGSHQGGSGGTATAGSSGSPQGGSAGMPQGGASDYGVDVLGDRTYRGYQSCSCDASGFTCRDLYPPTKSESGLIPPGCSCGPGEVFSCQDLSQNLPQDFWVQIQCVGTSTKGAVTLQLYDGPPTPRFVACGDVIDEETVRFGGGTIPLLLLEGGLNDTTYSFPVGGSDLIVLTVQLN